ncbi:MAG: DUF4391 domain-containing protein [Dietzia sp.]|nr:DUF4391 domain-containing protein [Dietzia sp.]
MTGDDVIAALDLPASSRVERRVPKTLLVEHGAPTTADKRRINDGIERIQWVAALKPATVGVAAYRDEAREYLEIAVLRVTLRAGAKVDRLAELLHRAVPYPVFGLVEAPDGPVLSLAHLRWSQGEAGKTVLDGARVAVAAPADDDPHCQAFAQAMALSRQPRKSLHALYQGWIDTLLALEAARRTGRFEILATAERWAARREALAECARLDAEISRLSAAAKKEKQMARKVELNLKLKEAKAARAAVLERM